MKAYKIWCEWDIGEYDLYDSEAEAMEALESNPNVADLVEDNGFYGIEEIFKAGLLSIEEVNIVSRKKS